MKTFKLTLSYDGTNYAGWQIQKNACAIQEIVERAVTKIAGQPVRVTASGRTDSGVHAYAQIAGCQFATRLDAPELLRAINGNLPLDIRVTKASLAPDGFDPIRHATRKSYRYVLQDGRIHDVFQQGYCWFTPGELNVRAMQQAAEYLVGEFDFSSFQSAGSYRVSTVRHVDEVRVARRESQPLRPQAQFIDIDISSNGFLYNMVRNMVGTLVEVGREAFPPEWVREVRDACDRQAAGPLSPPQGLFLVSVEYASV